MLWECLTKTMVDLQTFLNNFSHLLCCPEVHIWRKLGKTRLSGSDVKASNGHTDIRLNFF